ncbi:MAG TPA: aminoacyl-tRNA hydrolase [Sorangium sp.]|nr:aminoacyl-tRNA hydrolase [Sorangium sp.]
MLADLHIDGWLTVPGCDLEFFAVRASGPGGQNVNKTATKVVLRFDVAASHALNAGIKARLRALAAGRIDRQGVLTITSQHSRYQAQNLADARRKLATLLRAAMYPPKRRVPTRPSKRVVRRRLKNKRHNADKKRLRRAVRSAD